MDILGVGPLELFFIIIIALIVLGPKDMQKAGRTIGKYLRLIVKSDSWRAVQQTTNEIRNLPNKLMREAGVEEDLKEINTLIPDTKLNIPSWDDVMGELRKELERSTDLKALPERDKSDQFSPWTTPPPGGESSKTHNPGDKPNNL
jgi:Sec-independent protein translocase protein TatA